MNELGLTAKQPTDVAPAGGGCGCGGCGCGAAGVATEASVAPAVTVELGVTGMTCGHCIASVTEELSAIPGVTGVQVDLQKGGTSRVIVAADRVLDHDALAEAIDEAGYSLV
ncbi:MAG TPA: heavy-metal-associated domain-containing protein [Candidatus Lumbricidophila sp.]|nr:heavy-metal-associated domain-containing protein [Candidatus Lumbricidophila sp.]